MVTMMSDELAESSPSDEFWMSEAMKLADKAAAQGEIPVGAILIQNGKVIGRGWNQSITLNDPTAHAEVMALRDAGQHLNNYRIINSTMYVTLEPCAMCSGALVHSRIERLVFGAHDYKTGAVESVMKVLTHESANHIVEYQSGVCGKECSAQLSNFFKMRRAEKKRLKQEAQSSD